MYTHGMDKDDEHIYKAHNKTLLLYHIVCPVKYRKKAITDAVEQTIKTTCIELSKRYEIHFVEIGIDQDHVHFLIQSIPTYTVQAIIQKIKSITAREVFTKHPDIKKVLWGGKFWTAGYYANTVGQYAGKEVIQRYVQNQGKQYKQIHSDQLTLFN